MGKLALQCLGISGLAAALIGGCGSSAEGGPSDAATAERDASMAVDDAQAGMDAPGDSRRADASVDAATPDAGDATADVRSDEGAPQQDGSTPDASTGDSATPDAGSPDGNAPDGSRTCSPPDVSLSPVAIDKPDAATPCFDAELGSAMGLVTNYPCEDVPRRVYRWTAPFEGRFVFSTQPVDPECPPGVLVNPEMWAHEPFCGGRELAYDDNGNPRVFFPQYSEITLDLPAGQDIYVTVDHNGDTWASDLVIFEKLVEARNCADGIDNDFDGRVDCVDRDCLGSSECPDVCPDIDLGQATGIGIASGTLGRQRDVFVCYEPPFSAPETTVRWVAPRTGRFLVLLRGDELGLEVHRGPCDCGGTDDVVACVSANAANETDTFVELDAMAGEELTIAVDGAFVGSGPWILDITEID